MTSMDIEHTQPDSRNKFHWLFLEGERSTAATYDTVIQETEHFAVLPTRGSIVPGWVLVVPKFPLPRMADVPLELQDELVILVRSLISSLNEKFGEPYIFEHGGIKGSKVSCGVDQAHLHIASLGFDLVEAAVSESPTDWVDVSQHILPHPGFGENEYWFVSKGNHAKYKAIDNPSSQFFRKIIARSAGAEALWDYRSEDFMENVNSTLKALGADG